MLQRSPHPSLVWKLGLALEPQAGVTVMFRPNHTLLPSTRSSRVSQALQGLHNLQEQAPG